MRLLPFTLSPRSGTRRGLALAWCLLALLALTRAGADWPGAPVMLALLPLIALARQRGWPGSAPLRPWQVLDLSAHGTLQVRHTGLTALTALAAVGQPEPTRVWPGCARAHVGPWGCVLVGRRGHAHALLLAAGQLPQRQLRALQRSVRHGRPGRGGVQGSGGFPVSL